MLKKKVSFFSIMRKKTQKKLYGKKKIAIAAQEEQKAN
jgi:hypothetical protein